MKIDYETKTIRITLKPGEYLSISRGSTWFGQRVKNCTVGGVIVTIE